MGATSDNTAYTAHFVRPNFGYAETSYMLGTLGERAYKRRGKKDEDGCMV
jgi:hypothetical protein